MNNKMDMHSITYKDFLSMEHKALTAFLAYLTNHFPKPGTLNDDFLQSLATNLGNMDEQHLVYSIEILGRHSPTRLIPLLPWLLSDSRKPVWFSTERMLLTFVPKNAVTPEMLREFIEILRQHDISNGKQSPTIQWLIERFQI